MVVWETLPVLLVLLVALATVAMAVMVVQGSQEVFKTILNLQIILF
jgi:hypothetical protein